MKSTEMHLGSNLRTTLFRTYKLILPSDSMDGQNRDINWLLREGEFFSLSPQQLIDEVEKSPQDYYGFVNELCELTRHVDNYIKEKAAFALGVIGNPNAIECLIDLLNNENITEMIKDGSYEARVEAGFALAKIGGEPASEALESLIRSHENEAFVDHLIRALSSMDDPRRDPIISETLDDSSAGDETKTIYFTNDTTCPAHPEEELKCMRPHGPILGGWANIQYWNGVMQYLERKFVEITEPPVDSE